VQKLHNYLDIKGNALKKLSSRVQIFSFDIFGDHPFSFALITSSASAYESSGQMSGYFQRK